jgi:hypothetical protein
LGRARAGELLDALNRQRVDKKTAAGIHGTLFFELDDRKVCFPSKREFDVQKANMPVASFATDNSLKYIQLIDSSDSCTHDVCEVDAAIFKKIFIAQRQDIEFLEDLKERMGAKEAAILQKTLANRLVDKKTIPRIDGTLFIDLYYKKEFYPTKIDMEVEPGSRPF